MNLKDQLAAVQKDMRAIMEAAKADGREVTPEELSTLEAKSAEAQQLKDRIERAERSDAIFKGITTVSDPEAPEEQPQQAHSLGEFAAKSGVFDRWRAGSGKREASSLGEFQKAATDPFLAGTLGRVQYGGVVPLSLRRLTIADLMSSGSISGSSLTYWTQGAVEGAPTTVSEGGQKPQMHFQFTQVSEVLSKIAAITKVSDEAMDDTPYLTSVINSQLTTRIQIVEEDQLLNGNGTAPNLRGLLNRSGIQTHTSSAAADNLDAIYHAMTLVATGASQLPPDGIVINPTDYETFRTSTDLNGQYFGGGPFWGPYGNGTLGNVIEQPPLWGLRTVITPAIAAGTVLVGAFGAAAQVFRKGGIRVDTTNSDATDFEYNLVAIRAEERLLLAVYYASAFCEVTLA